MDFKLTNNDIEITKNDLVQIDGLEETKQRVIQRLQFFQGEWFLDRSQGIPYFQEIFGKGVQVSAVSAIFKNEILSVTGVIELLSFELDYNPTERGLVVNFSARSVSGVLSVSIPLS